MKGIAQALRKYATEERAIVSRRFFKTGKGQYGEGDLFIGVTVPDTRKVSRTFLDTSLPQLKPLLDSTIHEERMVALLILVEKYQRATSEKEQSEIVKFYLKNTHAVNNWDLVDLTADKIWGHYLLDKDRKILYEYARSPNLWERRMSVVATYPFIRNKEFKDTFALCEKLMTDKHDLMHKACGWMLREVGKRDEKALEEFLQKNGKRMPRTMLRYAIERFSPAKRKKYLSVGA